MSRRRGALLGAISSIIVAGVVILFTLRDSTPTLQRAAVEAAWKTWESHGLRDYTITVRKEIDRRQPELLVTEVREGVATAFSIDGEERPPRDSYTVPALFETIEREFEMRDNREAQAGQPVGAALKGTFDGTYGLPVVFKRFAKNRSFLLKIETLEVPGKGVVYPY